MKVLFIGGTGNISSACTVEAINKGYDLFHFNRGITKNEYKNRVTIIKGNNDNADDRKQLEKYAPFDVVANFTCFTPQQMRNDIEFFMKKTKQYIFISSATVYQKPPAHYIIKETTPLGNPFWEYAQNKIACEQLLTSQLELPYTIVRPSYTFGRTWLPTGLTAREYNPVYRMKKGLPIIIHGDGESLWVMTHNTDFAIAFTSLFGNEKAINNHFHITSDEVHTWNQIYKIIGNVSGCEPNIIYIPSDFINSVDPVWGAGLIGDKSRSMVFDNTKIKEIALEWNAAKTFEQGIRDSIAWFEEEPQRMKIDKNIEERMNLILKRYLNK